MFVLALLPNGSEARGVLGVGGIPVAILPPLFLMGGGGDGLCIY